MRAVIAAAVMLILCAVMFGAAGVVTGWTLYALDAPWWVWTAWIVSLITAIALNVAGILARVMGD